MLFIFLNSVWRVNVDEFQLIKYIEIHGNIATDTWVKNIAMTRSSMFGHVFMCDTRQRGIQGANHNKIHQQFPRGEKTISNKIVTHSKHKTVNIVPSSENE